ncbi:6-phosphofructokinase [Pseudomonas syringae pv. actinidiae]|nr:6-phosphofructokinase [Pseudomonas syringae pv. actinidiae]NAT42841.1 6-phosphofructokinase [Pseudomonas syringae pv. actinidiae]
MFYFYRNARTVENRKSKIENRKSKIENRKSKIENRKSKIESDEPIPNEAGSFGVQSVQGG